jgi:hypothetical protein
MQRRRDDGKRPRITVSLDPEDYEWVQSFKDAPSESFTVARIVKAARLAGLKLDDATGGDVIQELVEWLGSKRTKSAKDLHKLLSEFVEER